MISTRPNWGAFTPIELAVVIIPVAILLAYPLPAVQEAREAARRAECVNKSRQTGASPHHFLASHRPFPPGEWRREGFRELAVGDGIKTGRVDDFSEC